MGFLLPSPPAQQVGIPRPSGDHPQSPPWSRNADSRQTPTLRAPHLLKEDSRSGWWDTARGVPAGGVGLCASIRGPPHPSPTPRPQSVPLTSPISACCRAGSGHIEEDSGFPDPSSSSSPSVVSTDLGAQSQMAPFFLCQVIGPIAQPRLCCPVSQAELLSPGEGPDRPLSLLSSPRHPLAHSRVRGGAVGSWCCLQTLLQQEQRRPCRLC